MAFSYVLYAFFWGSEGAWTENGGAWTLLGHCFASAWTGIPFWSVFFEGEKESTHAAIASSVSVYSRNRNVKTNLPVSESDTGRFSFQICRTRQDRRGRQKQVFQAGGVKF